MFFGLGLPRVSDSVTARTSPWGVGVFRGRRGRAGECRLREFFGAPIRLPEPEAHTCTPTSLWVLSGDTRCGREDAVVEAGGAVQRGGRGMEGSRLAQGARRPIPCSINQFPAAGPGVTLYTPALEHCALRTRWDAGVPLEAAVGPNPAGIPPTDEIPVASTYSRICAGIAVGSAPCRLETGSRSEVHTA